MASYDLATAKSKVTDYGKAKWGRGPETDDEWATIGQGIDYGDGVDDAELQTAYGQADKYAESIGGKVLPSYQAPPAVTPPPAAPPPAAGDGSVGASSGAPVVPPALETVVPGLFNPAPPNPLDAQVQSILSSLMTRGSEPVSLDDPNLAGASDVFRSRAQRGAEKLRGAAAERAGATGTLESGGFDTEALGYQQDANFASAQHDSDLVMNETKARRDDLQKALALAQQSGQFDKAQRLQTQIALMNAALQKMGIDVNEKLGLGDIDVRGRAVEQSGALGRGDLGLRLMQTLRQNQQYYAGLGLSAAQIEAKLNQDALAILLGAF
jgi:hypothetical protein